MKSLVVYYSRSNNTETVAREISKAVNCETKKIKSVKDLSFMGAAFKALMGAKDKIKSVDFNADNYDNIFIGSPVWAGKSSTPINTFLSEVDFKGKNVFIFLTQGDGKAPYSVYQSIKERVESKGGKVIDSFFMQTNMKNPLTSTQAAESVSGRIDKNRSFFK